MDSVYRAVIQRDGKWWIGWIEEAPGVDAEISGVLARKICRDLGVPEL